MLKTSYFHRNTYTENVCATYHPCHWWHFAQNHARHWSSAASVHQHRDLGRPADAFLPIFCSQAGSDPCCWPAVQPKNTMLSAHYCRRKHKNKMLLQCISRKIMDAVNSVNILHLFQNRQRRKTSALLEPPQCKNSLPSALRNNSPSTCSVAVGGKNLSSRTAVYTIRRRCGFLRLISSAIYKWPTYLLKSHCS